MTNLSVPPPIPPPPIPDKQVTLQTSDLVQLPRRRKPTVKNDVPLGNKPGEMFTRTGLAKAFGLNVTTIGDWHNQGMPHEVKSSGKGYLYDMGQVLKWRVQHEHNLVKASMLDAIPLFENEMSSMEAERREKAAKAQLAELKLAKERGMVANIEDIMLNVGDALVGIRAGLMSFKSSLPGRLAHKDERYIERSLDKEIRNLLEKLSGYTHEYKGAESQD